MTMATVDEVLFLKMKMLLTLKNEEQQLMKLIYTTGI